MQFALDKRPNAEGRQMYSRSYALRPLYWTITHLGRPEHLVICYIAVNFCAVVGRKEMFYSVKNCH